MARNPILDDIRKFRDDFAKRHGYDMSRIVEAIRENAQDREVAKTKSPAKRQSKTSEKARSGLSSKAGTRAAKRRKAE